MPIVQALHFLFGDIWKSLYPQRNNPKENFERWQVPYMSFVLVHLDEDE